MEFPRLTRPLWPPLLIILLLYRTNAGAYFADWSVIEGRPHEPTCVDIPKNMSLCNDVGYEKMRLPNLLAHDTLTEVQQQSGSWVPLLNVRCHPHTKLFLCSLFTPVCLESQIFPCRSLCNSVQRNCEERMKTYGYHWPDMLRCDKFPLDNDMCIKAPNHEALEERNNIDLTCSTCNPVDTYENILDNFCRSPIVFRARIKTKKGRRISLRKLRIFKSEERKNRRRNIRLLLDQESECCRFSSGTEKYLIMGVKTKKNFVTPTFVLPWKKSKSMRNALKMFRNLNCSDPNLFSPTAEDGTIVPHVDGMEKTHKIKTEKKNRKKKKSNKKRNKNKNRKRKEESKNN